MLLYKYYVSFESEGRNHILEGPNSVRAPWGPRGEVEGPPSAHPSMSTVLPYLPWFNGRSQLTRWTWVAKGSFSTTEEINQFFDIIKNCINLYVCKLFFLLWCRLFYKQLEGLRKGWIQSSEESFYKSFRPESGFWFINFLPDLGESAL